MGNSISHICSYNVMYTAEFDPKIAQGFK